MNPKVIVIDGKTYHSVDAMPPEVRQKYEQAMRALEDADGNRIPDVFESMNTVVVPDFLETSAEVNSIKIIVDGKEFNGIENLPPEARARYEEAMGKLDANRNGIPDFVEGMINSAPASARLASSPGAGTPPRAAPLPVSPAITPDTSNGWALALGALFLLLLCAASAAGIWYFFFR